MSEEWGVEEGLGQAFGEGTELTFAECLPTAVPVGQDGPLKSRGSPLRMTQFCTE